MISPMGVAVMYHRCVCPVRQRMRSKSGGMVVNRTEENGLVTIVHWIERLHSV